MRTEEEIKVNNEITTELYYKNSPSRWTKIKVGFVCICISMAGVCSLIKGLFFNSSIFLKYETVPDWHLYLPAVQPTQLDPLPFNIIGLILLIWAVCIWVLFCSPKFTLYKGVLK